MSNKKWKVVYTEGFKQDMKRLFDWRYAPFRLWNKILYTPQTLKHYWQRITKGYSYQDVWSLDYCIANIIINGLKDLKKIDFGIPGPFTIDKKGKNISDKRARKNYEKVLQDIIGGYQAWLDDDWITKPGTKKKLKKAQELFNKYWGCFWW